MAGMEMDDMRMGDMQMENESPSESEADSTTKDSRVQLAPGSFSDHDAFDLPFEACTHCLAHSQPASGTATVIEVNPSNRSIEANAPPASFEAPLSSAFSISIKPLEHGPPGESSPRHVLVNVFRI